MNAPLIKRPFDVEAIRAEFPILARQVHGRPLVYLDNAASAQKPEAVIEAMAGAMRGSLRQRASRAAHAGERDDARPTRRRAQTVARFINAPSPESIVFTKGGTQAINIVAAGLDVKPGDEIVLSVMEHHSNIVPWHFLRERKGAVLKWLDIDDDGRIDLAALDALIGPRTKLVAITHMSNVLGARTPAAEIARMAHAKGVPVLFDGCQAVVHGRVDVQALDADFYAFTGHKLYGPTGIGVLYGKRERLAALPPFEGGGEMIDIVERERITYNEPPHRFEAGTPPILEAIGLRAAIDWFQAQDRARDRGARGGAARPRHGCAARAELGQAARAGAGQGRHHRLLRRGRTSPRRGADPGSTGCRGARRPPLRAALDAAARCYRYGPGELCVL